jgi:tetratricopeptide (TPR) repeat protein
VSLPSLAEVEHADWPALQRLCTGLGLNPKGRTSVVRTRVLDHVRRRVRPELWRPGLQQQAALLTRLGHPDASTRLWESTIQLDAPAPWVGLGHAQLGAGDLSEAARSFERAAQMGDAAAHLHRAEALAAAGKYEDAIRACDAFLEARPRELRGLLLKANLLARGGWTSEAATLLRDLFQSHPDTTELWKGLGTLLLRGRRYEAAAEAYRESLRASPGDLEVWIDRGAALLLGGRVPEAIGAFREVLEKDPHQAAALNDLGVAYLREGRPRPAAVTLERAAKHMETPLVLRNVAFLDASLHRRPRVKAPSRRTRSSPASPAHARVRRRPAARKGTPPRRRSRSSGKVRRSAKKRKPRPRPRPSTRSPRGRATKATRRKRTPERRGAAKRRTSRRR